MRATTKNKILDAAELLFAERGFSDTSLRLITSAAEVNLASVNYHFGSKKALIKAVLARYMEDFMPDLEQQLDRVIAQDELDLLQVFQAFVKPLVRLSEFRENGTNIFMQLLGRGYTDSQGHLRWFLTSHYGGVLEKIARAVRKANPELNAEEFFWRMHFTLGTAVFTMASNEALRDIARVDFGKEVDVEGLIQKIIPFLAAGVGAPITIKELSHA